MTMEKDVMRMRAIKGLDLPAGKSVELKPGGYHVMLMDLKQQMKEGDTVPVTLVVEGKDKKRTNVEVKASVKAGDRRQACRRSFRAQALNDRRRLRSRCPGGFVQAVSPMSAAKSQPMPAAIQRRTRRENRGCRDAGNHRRCALGAAITPQ